MKGSCALAGDPSLFPSTQVEWFSSIRRIHAFGRKEDLEAINIHA